MSCVLDLLFLYFYCTSPQTLLDSTYSVYETIKTYVFITIASSTLQIAVGQQLEINVHVVCKDFSKPEYWSKNPKPLVLFNVVAITFYKFCL